MGINSLPTQTMSNPAPLRNKRAEKCDLNDGKITSTFRSSFQPHNVKACREMERSDYLKNKGKAGKGGEWWGHVDTKFETSSCYRDSFQIIDYKIMREQERSGKLGPAAPVEDEKMFRQHWFQYRMKKPPRDDPGKFHDILTGQELARVPSGVNSPTRRVGRVSIDKLNAEKYGSEKGNEKRTYNIISNAPLTV